MVGDFVGWFWGRHMCIAETRRCEKDPGGEGSATFRRALAWSWEGRGAVADVACTTFCKNWCKTLQRPRQAIERGAHHFFAEFDVLWGAGAVGAFANERRWRRSNTASPQMDTD